MKAKSEPANPHEAGLRRLADTIHDALPPGWLALAIVSPRGGRPQLMGNLLPETLEAVLEAVLADLRANGPPVPAGAETEGRERRNGKHRP